VTERETLNLHRLVAILMLPVGIAVLAVVALRFARRLIRKRPETEGAKRVTLTGFALYGCVTLMLLLGVAAPKLAPEGPLGRFLSTPQGMLAYYVAVSVGFSVAASALSRLGYPILRGPRRDRPRQ
jgi:hypothetical protein